MNMYIWSDLKTQVTFQSQHSHQKIFTYGCNWLLLFSSNHYVHYVTWTFCDLIWVLKTNWKEQN